MISDGELCARLSAWFARQLPGSADLRIEGLDRVAFGHSAEILMLALAWKAGGEARGQQVVLRLRPPPPGLLEPYDMARQFRVLRALEGTEVRAPRALWLEPTGSVLGRPFFVMERLPGEVYELDVPEALAAAPLRVRRMCEAMAEQIAAIHRVDLGATGLDALDDGRAFLGRQLDHWAGEMERVRRGPLPALERLLAALREGQPEPSTRITLVHGDPKPGNFAFRGDEVSGVFDWEMAAIGDPLADIGWAEITWATGASFVTRPGALGIDEFVARYEALSGIPCRHRAWYRAFQGFKLNVILLLGAMLFDRGHSDDLRLAGMGHAIPTFTQRALAELGIDEALEPGPVTAREDRIRAVRERVPARGATR